MITPLLPFICEDLGVPIENIGFIISIFAVTGMVFTPLFSRLSDLIGRK